MGRDRGGIGGGIEAGSPSTVKIGSGSEAGPRRDRGGIEAGSPSTVKIGAGSHHPVWGFKIIKAIRGGAARGAWKTFPL